VKVPRCQTPEAVSDTAAKVLRCQTPKTVSDTGVT